jgi:hypothetical protein
VVVKVRLLEAVGLFVVVVVVVVVVGGDGGGRYLEDSLEVGKLANWQLFVVVVGIGCNHRSEKLDRCMLGLL